jgi:hypothetical protein
MVKRVVTADDVMGSGIAKYVGDLAWWCQASGQPYSSVEVFWKAPPSPQFDKVEISFANDAAAQNFELHMKSYGVRVGRA